MTHALRIRVVVTAILLAALLAVSVATPILSNVTEFGGTVYAEDCAGSGC